MRVDAVFVIECGGSVGDYLQRIVCLGIALLYPLIVGCVLAGGKIVEIIVRVSVYIIFKKVVVSHVAPCVRGFAIEQQVVLVVEDAVVVDVNNLYGNALKVVGKTNEGEDLLNLFFTTFNKYTGKADKNQAFTPTHITDFMTDLVHLTEDSKVLDITCGSGAFLIQAMKKMLALTSSQEKKKEIKSNQIYGIEREENAFGLATTNMLIHQDGKSNIICANCFDKKE